MKEHQKESQTKADKRERKRRPKMRVSGTSVFKIKDIITKKAKKRTE